MVVLAAGGVFHFGEFAVLVMVSNVLIRALGVVNGGEAVEWVVMHFTEHASGIDGLNAVAIGIVLIDGAAGVGALLLQ